MKIICGLGNPGRQYELTHHNMGFLVIDELAEKTGTKLDKLKFRALTGEFISGTEKIILIKPQTFMNLSGESLREAVAFYKLKPEDILLVYDDIDIALGTLRMREKGSAGSHNGMKSVIYNLQFDNFPRIRIGIGNQGSMPLDKFVLSGISDAEAKLLKPAVEFAAEGIMTWIKEGSAAALQQINNYHPLLL